MKFWRWLVARFENKRGRKPAHLSKGSAGEKAARDFLQERGLKFLCGNFRSRRGEIDLIMREGQCLVFIEVKTRSPGGWVRPSRAVSSGQKKRISLAAMDYLKEIGQPAIKIRFDIVEVLWGGGDAPLEIRQLENAFNLAPPLRYG
jgi:putative endonuclease